MKGLKIILLLLVLLAISSGIVVLLFQKSIQPQVASDRKNIPIFTVTRLLDTPIVHPTMHLILEKETQEYRYININGPSLISVPDWVQQPLEQYYL